MSIFKTRHFILIFLLSITLQVESDDKILSSELMVQELESLSQLTAYGQKLYEDDAEQQGAIDYCTGSLQLAETGEFRRALREASKTIYLGKESDKKYHMEIGTRNMAIAYSFANDLENAERLANIIIDKYSSERLNVIGPAYKVIGDVRIRQMRYKEAAEYYAKSLDNSPEWLESMITANLARSYALMKQYEKSKEYYERASKLASDAEPNNRTDRLIGTFGKIGSWMQPTLLRGKAELAYLQGEYDKAIALYNTVKEVAEGDTYQDVWVFAGKARALWAKGNKSEALLSMEQAIDVIESLRAQFRSEEIKIGLFSNTQDVFDEAIDMYMSEGKPKQALLVSEKSRARALLDMVRNRVSLSDGTTAFSDPLRKVAGAQQIQASIPANTEMVVFHSNPQRTYAWVINKNSLRAVTLDEGRAGLTNKVRQLREQIQQAGDVSVKAKELYELLIQPLAIKKSESVIIVSHKSLHFLPFQALLGPDGYFIENHQLRQVPSASILALNKRTAVKLTKLLALGNPKLASPEYDLPGAQSEVESIAKLYATPKIYLRDKATRSRIIEEGPQSQIIHIAAHAEVDETDPLYSRILLAADTPDRKHKDLMAKDIYNIDLHNTALVVLSACQSGLGKVTGGDELFGFTRTFISAGASQMIVSLWNIEDMSTSALMDKFYKSAQKNDLASALQQAQLDLLKDPKTRHPLFWAGFNLTGTL